MDIVTFAASIGKSLSIPGTAAERSEAAAEAAQQAAELAIQHSYGVSVNGETIVFTANNDL